MCDICIEYFLFKTPCGQHGTPSTQLKRYLARMEKEGLVRVGDNDNGNDNDNDNETTLSSGEDALNHHWILPDLLGYGSSQYVIYT